MIFEIFKWTALLFLSLCVYLSIVPLVRLLQLKAKHGSQVEIIYFPILGMIFYIIMGITKHKDACYYRKQIIYKNPKAKAIICNFFLNQIQVLLIDPMLIKSFTQNSDNYHKDKFLLFNDLLFEKSLLFTEGEKWKLQRKFLGQQFTHENLKSRIPIIKEIVEQQFSSKVEEFKDIKLVELLGSITGDVVITTFFGQQFCSYEINGMRVTQVIAELIEKIFKQTFQGLWTQIRTHILGHTNSTVPRFLLSANETKAYDSLIGLRGQVSKFLDKRIEDYSENEKSECKDFLQMLIQEMKLKPNELDREEIISQFLIFFFAGMDTTSHLVCFCCYALSQDQEMQNQVRKNVIEHIKNYKEIDHQNIFKATFLTALINETLRLYPPADTIFPRIVQKDQLLGPFLMKKGAFINVDILCTQRCSLYYKNPEQFSIDRWLDQSQQETQKISSQLIRFAFIPFSAGARNCIGQHMAQFEARIMLVYLLLNYQLIPDPKRKLVQTYTTIYAPEDDRLVHFQKLK